MSRDTKVRGSYGSQRPRAGGESVCCPECGVGRSSVLDTRHFPTYTRRRRVCCCGFRFTTRETCITPRHIPNYEI